MSQGQSAGSPEPHGKDKNAIRVVAWPQVALLPEASPLWCLTCRGKASSLLTQLATTNDVRKCVEQHWFRLTEVRAQDSAFTLILPIHNEERSLASVLHSLLAADLPRSTPACIVLVTNACRDRSANIVRDFLAFFGEATVLPEFAALHDDGIRSATEVQCGALRWLHIDTATPGKANALNLGNRWARKLGHRIALSLDTNNWIEPDSLAVLFGDAHRRMVVEPDGTAMLYARPVMLVREHTGSFYNRMQRKHAGIPVTVNKEELSLPGWMMAWDSAWLESVGEVPHTATEDYAMAVVARGSGRRVGFSDARIWGFGIATLSDLLAGGRRFVRGELQLAARFQDDPEMAAQVQRERMHSGPFRQRWQTFAKRVRERPARLPIHLIHWLIWELAYHQGKTDYRKDPSSSSWQSISSTK